MYVKQYSLDASQISALRELSVPLSGFLEGSIFISLIATYAENESTGSYSLSAVRISLNDPEGASFDIENERGKNSPLLGRIQSVLEKKILD